jgi:hypothetical protein
MWRRIEDQHTLGVTYSLSFRDVPTAAGDQKFGNNEHHQGYIGRSQRDLGLRHYRPKVCVDI